MVNIEKIPTNLYKARFLPEDYPDIFGAPRYVRLKMSLSVIAEVLDIDLEDVIIINEQVMADEIKIDFVFVWGIN